MNIDCSDIVTEIDVKLKILSLSRFKYNHQNTESFLNIIDSVETSEDLSVQEIYNIVTNKMDETVIH